jgi:hypothetical protein
VAFRSQFHYILRPVPVEQLAQGRTVADIHLRETLARIADCLRDGIEVRRVGEPVDIDHGRLGLVEHVRHDRRAYEFRTPVTNTTVFRNRMDQNSARRDFVDERWMPRRYWP